MKSFLDIISFTALKSQIEKGNTEFVITPDKLDEKSKELYDHYIAQICALAAFSETDKKEEK